MSERVYINALEPNQSIEGVYTLQNCQLGLTRNGKSYLKCLLCDKTGRLPGRMWNASEELYASLPTDGFVRIMGQTQPYQGEIQIIIQSVVPVTPSRAELAELMPSTTYDIEEMFTQVRQMLGEMKSPSMRKLAESYLNDRELMAKFIQAPAASMLHHAFLGGLLEHTLSVMRLAKAALPLYPKLNADIVLMGIFIHDLGKCVELSWESGFGYTDEGQLIGHIARGAIWLEEKANWCTEQGEPLPDHAKMVLQHIILSHHGQPEFGALKLPSTPEAIFVSLLDNADAKMEMALDAARGDNSKDANLNGNFTEKVWALGTKLFRPDPLAGEVTE